MTPSPSPISRNESALAASALVPQVGPTQAGADQILLLPPSLELAWADPLHEALLLRLERDTALLIDASLVAHVATPCLQVLAAGAAGAQARGLGFAITAMSGVLRDAVRDLGLGAALDVQPHDIEAR